VSATPVERLRVAVDSTEPVAPVRGFAAAVEWCLAELGAPVTPAVAIRRITELDDALRRLAGLGAVLPKLTEVAGAQHLEPELRAALERVAATGAQVAALREQRAALARHQQATDENVRRATALRAEIDRLEQARRLVADLPDLAAHRDRLTAMAGSDGSDGSDEARLDRFELELREIGDLVAAIGAQRLDGLRRESRDAAAAIAAGAAEVAQEQRRHAAQEAERDRLRAELAMMREKTAEAGELLEELLRRRELLLQPYQQRIADVQAIRDALTRATGGQAVGLHPGFAEVEQAVQEIGRRLTDLEVTLEHALKEYERRDRARHAHLHLNDPAGAATRPAGAGA